MNTTRHPLAAPATAGLVHSSTRTALSANTDTATGVRTQVLRSSRLEMWWEAGELRVRCHSSNVMLASGRGRHTPGAR